MPTEHPRSAQPGSSESVCGLACGRRAAPQASGLLLVRGHRLGALEAGPDLRQRILVARSRSDGGAERRREALQLRGGRRQPGPRLRHRGRRKCLCSTEKRNSAKSVKPRLCCGLYWEHTCWHQRHCKHAASHHHIILTQFRSDWDLGVENAPPLVSGPSLRRTLLAPQDCALQQGTPRAGRGAGRAGRDGLRRCLCWRLHAWGVISAAGCTMYMM